MSEQVVSPARALEGPAAKAQLGHFQETRRKRVLPAWSTVYTHAMAQGTKVNPIGDSNEVIVSGTNWHETFYEPA